MIKYDGDRPIWIEPTKFPDLGRYERIAIDLETKDEGLQAKRGPGGVTGAGYILGVSVAVKDRSWYFSLNHPDSRNWDMAKFRKWFNTTMRHGRQDKVGANILYDLEWLRSADMFVEGRCLDVQVAEPLLDENRPTYSLDSLSKKYLPPDRGKQSELILANVQRVMGPKIKDPRAFLWKLPAKEVGVYAEYDAIAVLDIIEQQLAELEKQDLMELFDLETRLIPMLLAMRFRGVRINESRVAETRDQLCAELEIEKKKLLDLAGQEVDINRAVSIAAVFDAAGIPYPRTPKTGAPSFTRIWLEEHESPLAKQITAVRKVGKIIGTFIDGHILGNLHNGKIYCSFHQLRSDDSGTVSGRLSSSNPNLQQMPSRDKHFAKLIRGLFIPDEGEQWWKFDASQIEFRLIVHYASVANLPRAEVAANAYITDPTTDFHQWVADLVHRDRRPAKDINFGLAYNMGRAKLSRVLGLPEDDAEALFNEYHTEVPFMKAFSRAATRVANSRGYVKTLLKRRRRFNLWEPPMNYGAEKLAALPRELALAEYDGHIQRAHTYKAMNSIIQGSAADIMKKGMVDLYEDGVFDVIGIPSLTVHDELDGSTEMSPESNEALAHAKHVLEHCVTLRIPMIWDLEVGPNWFDVEEFKNV